MIQEFIYKNQKIIYEIKPSRGKYIRITVRAGRPVALAVPRHISTRRAVRFLEKKAEWIVSRLERMKYMPRFLPVKKKDFEMHKRRVAILVNDRLDYFNRVYGFTIKNIMIRNQKTRWGSCSSKGNLNFNARIALLPSHLADYIIVHELCHLKELNHSSAFWHLVAQAVPNWRARRAELRKIAVGTCKYSDHEIV